MKQYINTLPSFSFSIFFFRYYKYFSVSSSKKKQYSAPNNRLIQWHISEIVLYIHPATAGPSYTPNQEKKTAMNTFCANIGRNSYHQKYLHANDGALFGWRQSNISIFVAVVTMGKRTPNEHRRRPTPPPSLLPHPHHMLPRQSKYISLAVPPHPPKLPEIKSIVRRTPRSYDQPSTRTSKLRHSDFQFSFLFFLVGIERKYALCRSIISSIFECRLMWLGKVDDETVVIDFGPKCSVQLDERGYQGTRNQVGKYNLKKIEGS